MNLNQLVSGIVGIVNPDTRVTIKQSTGATEDATGRLVPQYTTLTNQPNGQPITGQKQPLTGRDIERFQQMGVQGVNCKMYLNGNYEGLFRVLGKGGDLLIFGGQTYLVANVMERWDDWCCVALTMQNAASIGA